MSYYNWLHDYFKHKHQQLSNTERLDDLFNLLEIRSNEYLQYYGEIYKDLYINPNDDILTSSPQIIQQVKKELYDFLLVLLNNNVKSCLQIGLGHFGSTHFMLSLICNKVVTIDHDIKHIAQYTQREILYNTNKEFFICGDSTCITTIDAAKFHEPYDCIFVDGNHTYKYVMSDFTNYYPMLKTDGIFAFHDVLLYGDRYDVPIVLKEINKNLHYISHSKEVGIAYFIK